MEPFSIRCTTCGAGLRVRKPDVIGQIVSCPKCSSMVMVERPTSSTPSEIAPTSSRAARCTAATAALRSTSYDQIEHLLAEGSPPQPVNDATAAQPVRANAPPPHPSNATRHVAGEDSQAPHRPVVDDRAPPPSPAAVSGTSVPHPPPHLADATPAPHEDWSSPGQRTARQWMVYAFAGVLGGGLALAAVSFLASRSVPNSRQIAQATQVFRDPSPAAAEDSPSMEASDEAVIPKPQTASIPPDRLDEPPVQRAQPPSGQRDLSPPTTVQKPILAEITEPLPPAPNPSFPTPAPLRAPVDRFADIDLVSHDQSRPTSQRLGQFDLPAEFRSQLGLDPPAREPIPPVDVDSHLRLPVNGMKFNAGLGDFLQLVSQMSAVPITIRPLGLRNGQLTLDSPVRLDGNDATVADLLASALRPLRLGYAIESGHVVVDRLENLSGELWLRKHDVHDLLESGMTENSLSDAVRMLVDPHGWGTGERDAKFLLKDSHLVLKDTEAAHFDALILLNKFRAARGLSLVGPLARSQVQFGWRSSPKILAQQVSIRSSAKTTFGEVVSQLDSAVEPSLHVIADWEALAPLGWEFGSAIEFAPSETQFAKVLDELAPRVRSTTVSPLVGSYS